MRFLKINEQQTITLKLHIRDLNDCQQAFVKRNNRERFLKTITCFSNVIIVRDYRKFHFIRLITNLKAAENKAKREIAKTARNLLNKQLTWSANHAVNKLKNMIKKLIARIIADEMKFAKFEKNTTKLLKQMKKQKKEKKTEKLNSNENLSDLNIIKYFYLNMTRSVNVSEVSYISSFRSEAKLKRRF